MAASLETFKVWITLLAACNENGTAEVSPIFLESICRIPIEKVEEALAALESPDNHSRSENDGGRRIERINGGFRILNYQKYRIKSYSKSKEAIRKREWREKRAGESPKALPDKRDIPGHVPNVPDSSASASASASSQRGKSAEKGDPGLPYIEKVSKVFGRANYNFDDRTIIYIANLCAEFPELNHEAELKSKMAWWVNHPITPKSNVCLQIRNWFLIARERIEERRARDQVGGRREPAAAHDNKEYDEFLANYAKAHGIGVEDIDLFKVPDASQFRMLKERKPEVLEALLGRGK